MSQVAATALAVQAATMLAVRAAVPCGTMWSARYRMRTRVNERVVDDPVGTNVEVAGEADECRSRNYD